MSSRTTYVLLFLFFAGLLGLWWADSARVPTSEQRRRMSGRVLPELIEARFLIEEHSAAAELKRLLDRVGNPGSV